MKRLFQYITTMLLLLTASTGHLAAAEYVTAVFTETEAGKAWDVDIRLRNTNTNYTAFQMDLSLPDGVSYVEGSLAPSSRIATHSALASTLSDGKLRLLAYSATNTAITGVGENSILTLKLQADQALSPGNYPVTISNILLSLRTGVEQTLDDANVTLTASSHLTKTYHLIYMVDGVEYARQEHEAGSAITPLEAPEKEGHTFSGWQNLPEVMPESDVTVTGTFTANTYNLIYLLDGVEHHREPVIFGAAITPLAAPEKEGHTFSGWQNLPKTMPAHDVTVTGTFTANTYNLIYLLDGVEHHREPVIFGVAITPLAAPEKEGHTFSGWQNLPKTMPAHDVTVTGTFTVNTYVANFYLDGKLYTKQEVAFGATIPLPEVTPAEGYAFSGWQNVPATMPAHDIDIHGTTIDTGIESIFVDAARTTLRQATDIRDLSGRLVRQGATTLQGLPRGIYLIGTQKVFVR